MGDDMSNNKTLETVEVVQANMTNADLIYGYDKFANQRGGHKQHGHAA